jgi:hypothetical protein
VTQIDNRSDRRLNQHDHHRKKHAQVTYQHPLKINNSNTHLGITIRWDQEVDLGRMVG